MKKRIATFFFVSSLAGFPTWAVAGLALSTLAIIGAAALGVSGVVLASPGFLTAAVFIGGAGILCSATSFCNDDPSTGAPVPSESPSPSSSPLVPADSSLPRSFSSVCVNMGNIYTYVPAGPSNYYPKFDCSASDGSPVSSFSYIEGAPGMQEALGEIYCPNFTSPNNYGFCDTPFSASADDGISLSNGAAPTAPSLELPSVSSLPPGSYELWPGSGLYGKPGDFVIYDMRESTGEVSGVAKTSLTENPDGSKALEIEIIGSDDPGKLRIDVLPDGTKVVTGTRSVNVTDSAGNPDKLPTAVVSEYASSGQMVGTSTFTSSSSVNNGPGPFTLSPSEGGDGTPISITPVDGGGDTGTGTGSCTSGDCSTESTQLANKGLLQSISGLLQGINDFFTGTSDAPGDPTAKTGADIKGASVDGSGAFTGLRGWQLPAHASQCPTSSFAWNGNTYTFDAHCQLANDHFAMFNGVMILVFSISALFIVLRA